MLQLSRPATWVLLFRQAHTDTDSDTGPGLPSQQHSKPALCSATAHWVLLLDSWCRSFNIALLANTHTGIKARIHITQAHTDTDAHIGQFLQGGNFGCFVSLRLRVPKCDEIDHFFQLYCWLFFICWGWHFGWTCGAFSKYPNFSVFTLWFWQFLRSNAIGDDGDGDLSHHYLPKFKQL